MKRRAQPALGTFVEISIGDAVDDMQLQAAFQEGFAAIHAIHNLMSFHAPDSDISRYNRATVGSLLDIHPHTAAVLAAARDVHLHSDGLFDVRVARQLVAWDYLPAPAKLIAGEVNKPGEMYSLPTATQVRKHADDWLDLGGIAKGYAVDCAIAALQSCGVQHACVNAGGDLRVLGQSQTVLIRDPKQPQNMIGQVLLAERALATSASYFSCKDMAGKKRSALLHPSTEQAIVDQHSYTVIALACLWADALTKVVAVSGNVQHPCLRRYDAEAFII
ncbi:FAD:protein FMN transferase [Undibacterium sp. FT79W]|uniref:FAD:protein FMN transferase n=1 Tax=Undibacterium sp. FT79W TaxID=2762296 RepID=UPI00164A974B|nr:MULTISPECIES: FAD:protein FMN transferase [unclassified Undibacterium]MBC3878312.1 FAD:protein FMN transferase [Undibacterium sp. FT79W]MBC3927324.1 FAD:protein FMN transferase [Undibacterium sp. CY21W]